MLACNGECRFAALARLAKRGVSGRVKIPAMERVNHHPPDVVLSEITKKISARFGLSVAPEKTCGGQKQSEERAALLPA